MCFFKKKKKQNKVLRNEDSSTLSAEDFIPGVSLEDVDTKFQKAVLLHRINILSEPYLEYTFEEHIDKNGNKGVFMKCSINVISDK